MLRHEGPCMGPVVNDAQFNKVWRYIDEAKAEGLTLVCGGERLQRAGYFIPPTVFVDVPTTARVWNEEIFGPVLCIRVRAYMRTFVHVSVRRVQNTVALTFTTTPLSDWCSHWSALFQMLLAEIFMFLNTNISSLSLGCSIRFHHN
jgi:hypothetical protein